VEEDYVFFNLCDTNKDGKIDEAEMTKYWRQLGMTQQKWADYLLDGSKDTVKMTQSNFRVHSTHSLFFFLEWR
jgi:Ca2+-binding EF-hand superfamily protein